ncbi:MAG: hypothetical protein F6K39_24350 [Okeania sp. SIO3B3]|nr:hypothetical protein [Okeania sp. SIO3B3]
MALHNCGMILSESRNHNPRVSVSPCPRVSRNHPSIQQRQKYCRGEWHSPLSLYDDDRIILLRSQQI